MTVEPQLHIHSFIPDLASIDKMPSIATIRSFALFAVTALVERAACVPQQGMYGWLGNRSCDRRGRGKNSHDLTFAILTATITPAAFALGSAEALPDLNAPITTTSGGCGACYIIADVAALIWYSEVFINTAATGTSSKQNVVPMRTTLTPS